MGRRRLVGEDGQSVRDACRVQVVDASWLLPERHCQQVLITHLLASPRLHLNSIQTPSSRSGTFNSPYPSLLPVTGSTQVHSGSISLLASTTRA